MGQAVELLLGDALLTTQQSVHHSVEMMGVTLVYRLRSKAVSEVARRWRRRKSGSGSAAPSCKLLHRATPDSRMCQRLGSSSKPEFELTTPRVHAELVSQSRKPTQSNGRKLLRPLPPCSIQLTASEM